MRSFPGNRPKYQIRIYGRCRTNLDAYQKERWPEWFQFPPREGDIIQAESGKILKVCRVTHNFDGSLGIELTKTC
jgi:hypothetical protein